MTPVFSPQDPFAEDPALADQCATRLRLSDTLRYPALPWAIEDLPGTQWLSVRTFRLVSIGTPEKGVEGYGQLGNWHADRFIVEHWVRWDVLDPDAKSKWYEAKESYLRGKLSLARDDLFQLEARAKRSRTKKEQKAYQEQHAEATARVAAIERDLTEVEALLTGTLTPA